MVPSTIGELNSGIILTSGIVLSAEPLFCRSSPCLAVASSQFCCLFVLFRLPRVAADLFPMPDEQVATSALRYRQKKYQEAWEAASQARPGGMREFMLGMSSQKLEQFEEAATHFGRAAILFLSWRIMRFITRAALFSGFRGSPNAALPLQRLIKEVPESPLSRAARSSTRMRFTPTGTLAMPIPPIRDSSKNLPWVRTLCPPPTTLRFAGNELDDSAGAVFSLRNIRLRYPSSDYAAQADKDLQRLEAKGNKVLPYTMEEKLQYATTLYDLKRYDEAAKILQRIPLDSQPAGTADRYLLKSSQALFKAKKYKEAQMPIFGPPAKKACFVRSTTRHCSGLQRRWIRQDGKKKR